MKSFFSHFFFLATHIQIRIEIARYLTFSFPFAFASTSTWWNYFHFKASPLLLHVTLFFFLVYACQRVDFFIITTSFQCSHHWFQSSFNATRTMMWRMKEYRFNKFISRFIVRWKMMNFPPQLASFRLSYQPTHPHCRESWRICEILSTAATSHSTCANDFFMLPWSSLTENPSFLFFSARYLVTSQDLTLIWIFFLQNVAAMPYITYINSRFRVVNRRRPFTSINFYFLAFPVDWQQQHGKLKTESRHGMCISFQTSVQSVSESSFGVVWVIARGLASWT